jgi:predicted kinase
MDKMKELYIIRGLPGSGKSTFAKSLGGVHFEADMYFELDGEYKFDPNKLGKAHEWCHNSIMEAMKAGESRVVVSNTFTQEWEINPYLKLAKEFEYMVFSVIVENRHEGLNVHGVPSDKLSQMRKRFTFKL